MDPMMRNTFKLKAFKAFSVDFQGQEASASVLGLISASATHSSSSVFAHSIQPQIIKPTDL